MRSFEGQLGFSIRSQTVTAGDITNYHPRRVREWLGALPRANTGETARKIYTRLSQSNLIVLPGTIRLAFLQTLTAEVERLQENLERHFCNNSVSMTPRQQKISELSRAIFNEYAIGYKTIIVHHLAELSSSVDLKLLGPALLLATYYSARLVGHCFQMYTQPPKRLWRELHLLFRLAESNKLDRSITVPIPKPAKTVTIRSLYKSCLLLALSNPNQLRSKDFWAIQFANLELAKKLRLIQPLESNIEFVVNLGSEAGPFHSSLINGDTGDNYLGIDVESLLFYLQSQLSQGKSANCSLEPTLIRHLIRALGNMATRAFSRTPCTDAIEIAIGLSGTHALIEHGEKALALSSGKVEDDALSTLEGSLKDVQILDSTESAPAHRWLAHAEEQKGDMWARMYRPKVSVNESAELQKDYHLQPVNLSKPLPKDYRLLPAAILNISPGGYCLKLSGDLPKQTQTDEIIGLLETGELGVSLWNIGVIRWMRRLSGEEIRAGIQLIAPNAVAVTTSLRSNKADPAATHRSLLLPSLEHIGQPATLITPVIPYAPEKITLIHDGTVVQEVKLLENIQSGRGFSRFTFRALSERPPPNKPQSRTAPDDFSKVWEIL